MQVRIAGQYQEDQGTTEEGEEALMALGRISASCSPLTMSTFGMLASKSASSDDLAEPGVNPALVSKTVANVLRLEIQSEEMLPLLHSLVDGLTDEIGPGARGASLILCSLLESRGHEDDIAGQATTFVSKLHGKLLILDQNKSSEETRGRGLMAVRILAGHNAVPVIDSLLNDHPIPFDDALVRNDGG
jgi:hypothetical protein